MSHPLVPNIITNSTPFSSGEEVAAKLAKLLRYYSDRDDTAIFSLNEAATTLAAVLAENLRLPHNTFIIRQLTSPRALGLSLGAVGAVGGQSWDGKQVNVVLNEEIIRGSRIPQSELDLLVQEQTKNVLSAFSNPVDVAKVATQPSTVLFVDVGVHTTTTVRSAMKLLRAAGYEGRLVLACAIIGADAKQILFREVGEVIALMSPKIIRFPEHRLEFHSPFPTSPSKNVQLTPKNTVQV